MNTQTDILHLPDLLFIQVCKEQFGVNRGVYNTIDSWLFQKGMTNILERRRSIYNFLSKWLQHEADTKFKVGHGNLTKRLNDYFTSL